MRFAPKDEVVIEVDSPGTEFYIVLKGRVQFYLKDSSLEAKDDETIKKTYEKWVTVPPHSGKRKRSQYPGKRSSAGVPKVKYCQKTTLKKLKGDTAVLFDGRPI